jgi:hypothetical protein
LRGEGGKRERGRERGRGRGREDDGGEGKEREREKKSDLGAAFFTHHSFDIHLHLHGSLLSTTK